MYGNRSPEGRALFDKFIGEADRFVFVVPEYNGSYAGITKLFLDALEPELIRGKKAALTGVAAGRFGNPRGIDQLTNVLHHLKVNVCRTKIYMPGIDKLINKNGRISDEGILKRIRKQLEELQQ